MSVVMASPTFSFDESKFIYKFVCDYYTENDFDLDSSFLTKNASIIFLICISVMCIWYINDGKLPD